MRRWCQKSKRNFLQDAWNGKYEFFLFDAKDASEKALPDDFTTLMQEMDEISSRASSPGALNVTWANEMQVTVGEMEEEQPFSEDEEFFALDFPDEHRNDWPNREWRERYEIALNEAFQRVYDRNEGIKNDPAQANLKPADIDPFWSHALAEIKRRNKEEDQQLQENIEGLAELPAIEIEDESEVTASAIYTATETESGTNENASVTQEIDLNDAIIGIESNLLADDENASGNDTVEDDPDADNQEVEPEVQLEGTAEVLIIERQEEVISNEDVEPVVNEMQMQRRDARNVASNNRFDAASFKARLIEFRKRQEIDWIYRNINKN